MEQELIDAAVKYCNNKVREYSLCDQAFLLEMIAKKLKVEADAKRLDEYFG